MPPPAKRDENDKDITATQEYKARLVEYQTWCKKDRKARYTLLCCMHDDLIGEFDVFPTAKEIWDNIRIQYGQTSETRLQALHLKWMSYVIDSTRSVTEHIRALQSMIRDLRAGGIEVSERDQKTICCVH